jgi:DNA-directed RNA polymerase subunit RPC12/RpoP
MTCPRCLSTAVTTDKEYVWYCQKCCRHEVRPLETELPFRQSMKEKQKYEKHMVVAVCTMCGKDFEKMPTTKRDVCTRCQNILFQRARSEAKRGGNAQASQSAHNGKISGVARQNTSAKEAKRNICGTGAASQWAAPGLINNREEDIDDLRKAGKDTIDNQGSQGAV